MGVTTKKIISTRKQAEEKAADLIIKKDYAVKIAVGDEWGVFKGFIQGKTPLKMIIKNRSRTEIMKGRKKEVVHFAPEVHPECYSSAKRKLVRTLHESGYTPLKPAVRSTANTILGANVVFQGMVNKKNY